MESSTLSAADAKKLTLEANNELADLLCKVFQEIESRALRGFTNVEYPITYDISLPIIERLRDSLAAKGFKHIRYDWDLRLLDFNWD